MTIKDVNNQINNKKIQACSDVKVSVLTGNDLEAIPEFSDFDIRDDGAVPTVDQVHILVSKLLTEGLWPP